MAPYTPMIVDVRVVVRLMRIGLRDRRLQLDLERRGEGKKHTRPLICPSIALKPVYRRRVRSENDSIGTVYPYKKMSNSTP